MKINKKIILSIFLVTYLSAYEKTTDSKNVYFHQNILEQYLEFHIKIQLY